MKYKGAELKEMDTKNINWTFYETPRKLLVWDSNDPEPTEAEVLAIMPERADGYQVITSTRAYGHCAEIPEPKLATYRELAIWLARGNGEMQFSSTSTTCYPYLTYQRNSANMPIGTAYRVRKWSDTEWHSPTREYLGLED